MYADFCPHAGSVRSPHGTRMRIAPFHVCGDPHAGNQFHAANYILLSLCSARLTMKDELIMSLEYMELLLSQAFNFQLGV